MFPLTIEGLKNYLVSLNLAPDTPVLIERVHDVYFKKHNWSTKKGKPNDDFPSEYIRSTQCYIRVLEDGTKALVIDAHY